MKYLLSAAILLLTQTACAATDDTNDGNTTYNVSFDGAAHHEATISVTYTDITSDVLEARMSRSSPGRYALHEFAKNVYNVKAVDSTGKELTVTRPDPYQWNISGHDGKVTITYTLFANRAGGTYSQVDRTHAHLNIPATFMWAKGREEDAIRVNFTPFDDSWKVATQLVTTDEKYSFTAPNLYYFMDSPTELSNHMVRAWDVDGQTIKLAVHHAGSEAEMDKYADMAKKVVLAQKDVYGELAKFDYGEYVFISCYLPQVNGDGMEHRNSTILTNTSSFAKSNFSQIGTLSHEFFHHWNVERIRPQELEPFDFTGANMTSNLWFAEGFTSYYGPLTNRRAGLTSVDQYVNSLSGFVNYVMNVTGRLYKSPADSSKMASFTDAGTSIDKTNFSNIFFSYYPYGQARALALDLAIRSNYEGKTLDGYMQAMWTTFGKTEKPYTSDDLRITLGKYLDDSAFADDFFAKYITGTEDPDYAALMAPAGLVVSSPKADEAWVGNVNIKYTDGVGTVASTAKFATPSYDAGLEIGDVVVSLGGKDITSRDDWAAAIASFNVGDTTTISYISLGIPVTSDITMAANPSLKVTKLDDDEMSDAQKAFLKAWIGE